MPDLPERIAREDLYPITETALADNSVLPDLFLCVGGQDFLYDRVVTYHQTFGHRRNRSHYRFNDLPGYAHE